MAQMPDIKPEVNKEPEKKKAGFLSGLFGGGGGGSGAAGFGGLGGATAGGGGGMLATKAGLLALVLAGTTVAGGIGLVGYRMFGPGESDQAGQNMQLFAPKPKEAAPDPNAAAAPKDGSSASLDDFAKVNSGALKGDAPAPAKTPKDETAAGASAASASSAAGSNAVAGASGNGASTSMLKNTKKLGALSTAFGGSAGSAPSAGSSSKAGDAASLGAMGKGGQLSGNINTMQRGAATASTSARGIGARSRRTGAQAQARITRDLGQQNQYSMKGAGRGFENSTVGAGGENIGDANSIGMGGLGTSQGASTKAIPKPVSGDTKEVQPADPPPTYDVTPYKKEMALAQMFLMLAMGMLAVANWLATSAKATPNTAPAGLIYAKILCGAAIALGVLVIALGVKISGGEFGQKTQGAILALSGAAVAVAAGIAISTFGDTGLAYNAPTETFMYLGGAGVLIATVVGPMIAKPKTCTGSTSQTECTPGSKLSGMPSENALARYLA